jgi:hypothetical protein
MPKSNRASAIFLSRGWRKETERAEFLEGKIKARSRTRSQAIVCTSFFGETRFGIGQYCETLAPEVAFSRSFDQSLGSSAQQMAFLQ